MPDGSTDSIDLAGIEDGKAPKSRLEDASKAHGIVQSLITANAKRAATDASVKGQLDGNPPFDAAVLRRNSQSHRTNINFREAEGVHNAAVSPFYDLFAEAPWYCEVQTDYGEEAERVTYSKVITKHFDRMVKDWKKFNYSVEQMISDRTDFGHGFFMWADTDSWRPEVVKHSKVLVPDGTDSTIEDLEVIVIREEYKLHRLWQQIKNAKTATAAGWYREIVLREMYCATPEGSGRTNDSDFYGWYQQQMRNNDLSESVRSKTVAAAHVLVKEFDGKVSHLIISENEVPKEMPGGKTSVRKSGFMFQRIGQFNSFREVLAAFFYDIGDGTWHSVKGLLVKLYPFVALKDRLNCATLDNAFLNMSVLVKASKNSVNDVQMIQVGPMTIIPSELEVQQWTLGGRMEESLVVERHLDQKLSSNIGQYRQTVQKETGNPETATKVMADQSKEASLSKSAVNRFYAELDFFYEEMYRRASNPKLRGDNDENKAALAFQKRCGKEGVPKEALTSIRSVRAYRNIGNGSIFMRQAAFRDGMAIVPLMNEEGKVNWLDDALMAIYGQGADSRYNPKPKEMRLVQDQANLAMIENGAIKDGIDPLVTSTQLHVVHADIHLKAASDAAVSLQQGANPMDVLSFMELAGQHTIRHLQQIANDPTRKQQYDALNKTWKQLASFTDQLSGRIQQMQQQQQAQTQKTNGAMAEQELAELKTRSELSRKERKLQLDLTSKSAKAQQQLQIAGRKASQSEAIADIRTAKEIQRDNAKEKAGDE